jgi:hypothetical protein
MPAMLKATISTVAVGPVMGPTRGVFATLAWQSYGDAAREMIASSYPQLGWLAPPAAPDASSPDLQELKAIELKAMSTDLAAVRQSVD